MMIHRPVQSFTAGDGLNNGDVMYRLSKLEKKDAAFHTDMEHLNHGGTQPMAAHINTAEAAPGVNGQPIIWSAASPSPPSSCHSQSLDPLITCGICSCVYQSPSRVLLCQHFFCETCLAQRVEKSGEITCPLCSHMTRISNGADGVSFLPTNEPINQLVKRKCNPTSTRRCNIHQKKLKYICEKCGVFLCSSCAIEEHDQHPITSQKEVASLLLLIENRKVEVAHNAFLGWGTITRHFHQMHNALEMREKALLSQLYYGEKELLAKLTGLSTEIQELTIPEQVDRPADFQSYSSSLWKARDLESRSLRLEADMHETEVLCNQLSQVGSCMVETPVSLFSTSAPTRAPQATPITESNTGNLGPVPCGHNTKRMHPDSGSSASMRDGSEEKVTVGGECDSGNGSDRWAVPAGQTVPRNGNEEYGPVIGKPKISLEPSTFETKNPYGGHFIGPSQTAAPFRTEAHTKGPTISLAQPATLHTQLHNLPPRPSQSSAYSTMAPYTHAQHPIHNITVVQPLQITMKKPRVRRTNRQLLRNYDCTFPDCRRRYASQRSLVQHRHIKHPGFKTADRHIFYSIDNPHNEGNGSSTEPDTDGHQGETKGDEENEHEEAWTGSPRAE